MINTPTGSCSGTGECYRRGNTASCRRGTDHCSRRRWGTTTTTTATTTGSDRNRLRALDPVPVVVLHNEVVRSYRRRDSGVYRTCVRLLIHKHAIDVYEELADRSAGVCLRNHLERRCHGSPICRGTNGNGVVGASTASAWRNYRNRGASRFS